MIKQMIYRCEHNWKIESCLIKNRQKSTKEERCTTCSTLAEYHILKSPYVNYIEGKHTYMDSHQAPATRTVSSLLSSRHPVAQCHKSKSKDETGSHIADKSCDIALLKHLYAFASKCRERCKTSTQPCRKQQVP